MAWENTAHFRGSREPDIERAGLPQKTFSVVGRAVPTGGRVVVSIAWHSAISLWHLDVRSISGHRIWLHDVHQ